MTEIATVRVQILGREFPVACPAGQEHELEAAAEFVDNRMRDIQEKNGEQCTRAFSRHGRPEYRPRTPDWRDKRC